MMGSTGDETRRCPCRQGPRVLHALRAAETKFSFWKVLGARPLPAHCLREGGRGGGKEGGCPTRVCSRGSSMPRMGLEGAVGFCCHQGTSASHFC